VDHPKSHLQTGDPGLRRRRSRSRSRWLALGTVTAYAAVAFARPSPQQSASAVGTDPKQTTGTQNLTVRRFNIPSGPLDVTVASFERITGAHVALAIPEDTIPGFSSPGVAGLYSDSQAMNLLLTGTGLSATPKSDGSFVIAVTAKEDVIVSAQNSPPQIELDRYPMPLLDTPQAITVISRQTIQEQASTTLRDVLRNAPGISLAAGEGGSQGDNLTLRGFTARNDIFLDGMRDFGSYYRDPFNYEAVEVLEGPSSVTFGRGSTGGVINQESKQPELHPFTVIEGDLATDVTRRITADINQPLPKLATGAAVRLNVMAHDSNVAERDVTENKRFGIAPEFALGLGTPNRLRASYFHFNENDIPDYGIPWYFNHAADVPRHNYYGFHSNFLDTNVNMGTIKAEHDIDGWATLRNSIRYANSERHARITEPQVNNATAGIIAPTTPLDQVNVNRNQLATYSNESFLWDQLDATIHANTFGIRHVAVIGAEGGRETSDPKRPTFNYVNAAGQTINTVPTTELLRPNEDQQFSGTSAPSSDVHAISTSYGIYLLDTMSSGSTGNSPEARASTASIPTKRASPIPCRNSLHRVPLRKGRPPSPILRGSTASPAGAEPSPTSRAKTAASISATALHGIRPPKRSRSPWVLAAPEQQILRPSSTAPTKSAANGTSTRSRLSLRADLFRTTKDNAREASPTNSLLYVLAGTQRVDGAEVVANGRINSQWRVLSSYTHMHSEVVASQFYPQAVGAKLANVPDNLFNLWTTYQPTSRWIMGLGGNYVGSRTASSTVPLDPTTGLVKQVPGYWLFNAMGSYSLAEHVSLQANIFNLANRNYIDQIHPAHLVPGAGTSGLFGLNFKF
jgi:catecholate siderophore receptor